MGGLSPGPKTSVIAAETNLMLKGEAVLVVCRSGHRSLSAVATLRMAGFSALNLSGGMDEWARAGNSVVRDGGAPGTVI